MLEYRTDQYRNDAYRDGSSARWLVALAAGLLVLTVAASSL
jgi:hypothetical protein